MSLIDNLKDEGCSSFYAYLIAQKMREANIEIITQGFLEQHGRLPTSEEFIEINDKTKKALLDLEKLMIEDHSTSLGFKKNLNPEIINESSR